MARPRSDIRPRILEAARARFLKQGVDGASLRAIATDAGTNIGMVYYYFETKAALFEAVVEDVYGGLLVDLSEAFGGERPFEERMRRASGRMGRLSPPELDVVRLVIREALVSSERRQWLFERFSRGHVGLALGAISRGVEDGEVTGRIPTLLLLPAAGAIVLVPQIARQLAIEHAPHLADQLPDTETLARLMLDVLLHGIATEKPA